MGSVTPGEGVLDDGEVGVRGAGPAEGGEGAPGQSGVFAQSGYRGNDRIFHDGGFVVRRMTSKSLAQRFVRPEEAGKWVVWVWRIGEIRK